MEVRRLTLVCVALLGLACPALADDTTGATFGLLTTAQAVLSGDTDPAVVPGIRLSARGPLALGDSAPLELYAALELTALPGETVDLTNVATFRAAEFEGGIAVKVGEIYRGTQILRTLIFAEGAFATRLPATPGPLERYPRRLTLGVEVRDETGGARLKVGYGNADVAGPAGWRQLFVAGEVPLYEITRSLDVVLGGDAILTIGKGTFVYAGGAQRDVFRVFLGMRVGG
jgi:hypothetical protein